ncbi:MAG: zf-TFIIB domain-containing protein [Pirellula sp.]
MKCPTCINVDLHMSERQGIEIDYCPKCRGVWLDRGELDKFIQQSEQRLTLPPLKEPREEAWTEQPSRKSYSHHEPPRHPLSDKYRRDSDDDHQYPQHRKKRESFWGELFDFD